jgi:4-amino-4-deoxy-L-arabinose transferase-like glycosyltransferase
LTRSWNKELLLILLIVFLAFSLRAWGVGQGLPASYYPDERHFINRAMSFGTGDLNPHWFHKPALYMYVLFLEYGLFYLIGRAAGVFAGLQDLARLYINNLTAFLLIGRCTTVLLGTATVWLVYRLARRMYGWRAALAAALFLCFTFAHVQSSQQVKADVPMAFLALVSFVFIYRIRSHGRWQDYLWAGFFAGLGMATKYTPVVLLFPIFLAHLGFLASQRSFPWRHVLHGKLFLSPLFLCCGFFLGSPYNLLDPYWIQTNLATWFQPSLAAATSSSGSVLSGLLHRLVHPVIHFAGVILRDDGLGPVMGVLSLAGLLYLIVRRRRGDWLIVLTVLSVVIVSGLLFGSYAEARHFNIVYPLLALGLAALVTDLAGRLVPDRPGRAGTGRGLVIVPLSLLIIIPSARAIIDTNIHLARTDTRTHAKRWIEANLPPGSRILVDDYCVPLKMSPGRITELLEEARKEARSGPFTTHASVYYRYYLESVEDPSFHVYEISHPWWMEDEEVADALTLDSEYDRDMGNPLKTWGVSSLESYRAQGYRYLVTTEAIIGRYRSEAGQTASPAFVRFYRQVKHQGRLLRTFDPEILNGPGPRVLLYEFPPIAEFSRSESE